MDPRDAMDEDAPSTAVTIPAGSSAGRSTTRPTMSAASSSTGASTIVYARIQRWSGPTIQRAMCGIISPTNAIGPAIAVAPPASSVTATTATARTTTTFAPRDRARSSPSATASRLRAMRAASRTPAARKGATGRSASQPRSCSEPDSHARIALKPCGSASSMPEVMPARTAPRATPASVRRTGSPPPRPADPTTYTTTAATSAPPKANQR
ncbi:hypothetical protein CMMCAS05_11655 [Clavibacter michiganensis subsp. michiganensis]|nr:hypothetical protein CMMCAS05_11655 [Clavibacter michiganensis subsp. michiganensis]